MLDIINKAAITVIPKEPFIKWVQSTHPKAEETSAESIGAYSQVYLVDASEDGDDPEKLIKRNFKVIFEEELAGWYTDEEAWPKKMVLPGFPWVTPVRNWPGRGLDRHRRSRWLS